MTPRRKSCESAELGLEPLLPALLGLVSVDTIRECVDAHPNRTVERIAAEEAVERIGRAHAEEIGTPVVDHSFDRLDALRRQPNCIALAELRVESERLLEPLETVGRGRAGRPLDSLRPAAHVGRGTSLEMRQV